MKKLVFIALLFAGCISSSQKNEYIDGTSLTIGLWLPVNGNLYGLQAVNFITGKKISLNTNQYMKVESSLTSTTSIAGIDVSTCNSTKID